MEAIRNQTILRRLTVNIT